jgi:hypothetical protein
MILQRTGDRHTLSAAANKLRTLPDKVLRDISKFLESLRHCGWRWIVGEGKGEVARRREQVVSPGLPRIK